MDVGDADPLLLSCILLEETCKELAAILLVKSAELTAVIPSAAPPPQQL